MTDDPHAKAQERIREITHQNVLRLLGEMGVMKAELSRLSEENESLRKSVAHFSTQLGVTNGRIGAIQARLFKGGATAQ